MKKLILLLLLIPSFAFAAFDRDLYYGLRNDPDVEELQEFLTSEGFYSGPITGNFFSLTLKAVKDFQVAKGIFPSAGYFGPKTSLYVNGLLAKNLSGAIEQGIQESGTSTVASVVEEAKQQETGNVLAILQEQIALLTAQLEELRKQNTRFTTPSGTVVDYFGNVTYKSPEPIVIVKEVEKLILPPPPPPPAPAPVPASPQLVPEMNKSEVIVKQVYGPGTLDPTVNLPYGEYIFRVSALDKAGKYRKDALLMAQLPSDDLYTVLNRRESSPTTAIPNGITNAELGDWNVSFTYVPTTTGTKVLIFSTDNGNLVTSVIIEVK